MSLPHALILGILQGLTEFIPVSSSGHLVLAERFLELEIANSKFFDVVLHLGTSLAIITYFWKDWAGILRSFLDFLGLSSRKAKRDFAEARLGYYMAIGTIPAAIIGLMANDYIDQVFRSTFSVGVMMIIVGTVFLFAEKFKGKEKLTTKRSLVIGVAQALALIPGISRSGLTISAGMLQKMSREEAAKFSFMLGLPAILGAGILSFIKTTEFPDWKLAVTGFLASALVSFLAIKYMLRFLRKHSLRVFAYYLFVLGAIVLTLAIT